MVKPPTAKLQLVATAVLLSAFIIRLLLDYINSDWLHRMLVRSWIPIPQTNELRYLVQAKQRIVGIRMVLPK